MKVDLDKVAMGCIVSDSVGNLYRKISQHAICCESTGKIFFDARVYGDQYPNAQAPEVYYPPVEKNGEDTE